MTDYDRIKAYYSVFDEQHRLDNPEGRLEFQISLGILFEYLKKTDDILDLGGGAGKYAIELAKLGLRLHWQTCPNGFLIRPEVISVKTACRLYKASILLMPLTSAVINLQALTPLYSSAHYIICWKKRNTGSVYLRYAVFLNREALCWPALSPTFPAPPE